MTDEIKSVKSDAKSDTRMNVTLTALVASALMKYLEVHYQIKLSADDAMTYACAGLAGWHIFASGVAPYANRVFDRFFPPKQEIPK
jgi:hypothetical protein